MKEINKNKSLKLKPWFDEKEKKKKKENGNCEDSDILGVF